MARLYFWRFKEYSVIPSLQLLLGPLWHRVVKPVMAPSMSQVSLFKNYLYLIGILKTIKLWKLFVFRIVTWSSNCLQRIIIISYPISFPYTDLKPIISKFLHQKWQQRWDMNINNKLFQIPPTLGEWRLAFRAWRRERVVISRLRIAHTRLTHAFILKQEPQPQCLTCHTTCTVKHILIECRAFTVIRKWFFKVTSLTESFENIKIDDVLSFLWETGLYEKIWRIKTD